MNTKLTHQMVDINGIKLHITSAGDPKGRLLVFLHGFPEFWYGWRKQIEHFASLGYWVVVPDQRGYNLSDKPRGVENYALPRLVDDVAGLIAWAGHQKAIIVGHDWGAAVAWGVAMMRPEVVEKLVVLNVPHPFVMRKNLVSNARQILRSWYVFFFQLPKVPEWILLQRGAVRLRASLKNTSRPGTFSREELSEYQKAWQTPNALGSMINWYRAALKVKPKNLGSPKIKTPTLMIWGEKDSFLGKELASQSLPFCEAGRLEFLPNASHWVQHEEPAKVNQLIEGFI